jgi:hypothetical protein
VEEAHAHPILQGAYGVAERGGRGAEVIGRATEAAVGGDRHEGGEIIERRARH